MMNGYDATRDRCGNKTTGIELSADYADYTEKNGRQLPDNNDYLYFHFAFEY